MREMVGLHTYRYTFKITELAKYKQKIRQLESKGSITCLFINNGYGFLFKKHREV